jgi:hypothetical protein
MIQSPKQEFQRNKERVAALERVLYTDDFQTALMAAFNNLCWNLPASENPQHGWNANCRRQGAKALIEELHGLVAMQREKPTVNQNLE